MAVKEQIFHYSQGVKNRIRVEIERSEVATLPEAMLIADRMDSLYNNHRGAFIFSNGPSSGPVPMEIGQIPQTYRYKNKRPKAAERRKLMRENRCLVCRKVGHSPSQHRGESSQHGGEDAKTKQTVTVSRH